MQDQNEKTFSKLPLEIVEEVVKRLDPISRVVIRNVSKMLRAVSNRQKLCIQEMQIFEESGKICLKLNGDSVTFPVLNFLRPILSNPKLRIDNLHLTGTRDPEVFQKIIEIFKESSFHVKNIKINTHFRIKTGQAVSFTMPGVLESIEVVQHEDRTNIFDLFETEQFMQAKTVDVSFTNHNFAYEIDNFLRLKSFKVCICHVLPRELLHIRDILAESSIFENCTMYVTQALELFRFRRPFVGDVHNGELIHRHPISGTNDFLVFNIQPHLVTIERERF